MEEFLEQVRVYAGAVGLSPSTVVQKAGVGGGRTWRAWESGRSSPTLRTVDLVHSYIAANPATQTTEEALS